MKHNNLSRRGAIALVTGAAALSLGGCGSLLALDAGPPPRRYRLTSKSTYPDDLKDVNWQLVVEVPSAPASINTDRIGLMETPLRFNYYANANWVDRAPLMVQSLIIESFDNSGAIVGVGPESVGLRPDFVLKPELREFQAMEEGGVHRVLVVINARLVEMPERHIVAVDSFEASVEISPGQLDPIIEGFDVALGKVMKRLVLWALDEGEQNWKADQSRTTPRLGPTRSSRAPAASADPVTPIRRLPRPPPAR